MSDNLMCLNPACHEGSKSAALANLLGHDAIGHRVANALARSNIDTIQKASSLTRKDCMEFQGLGRHCIERLEKTIKQWKDRTMSEVNIHRVVFEDGEDLADWPITLPALTGSNLRDSLRMSEGVTAAYKLLEALNQINEGEALVVWRGHPR